MPSLSSSSASLHVIGWVERNIPLTRGRDWSGVGRAGRFSDAVVVVSPFSKRARRKTERRKDGKTERSADTGGTRLVGLRNIRVGPRQF
eukprot:3794966-Pyramimonas_sp.AAC.1